MRVFYWTDEMAIPWIKIETSLPRKPEVMQLAAILDIDEFAVVGHLVCFWSWVDENLSLECPVVVGTKRGLDRVAGRDGFADAMVTVGWLQMEDSAVSIPHLDYHLDQGAKTRAMEQRKKAKQRKTSGRPTVSGKCPDDIGTKTGTTPGPEERRGEKNVATNRDDQNAKPEHLGGIDDVIIPKKMQTPECQHAAAQWMAYLDEKGLGDKRPDGAIALQAWWSQMARIGPKDFPIMVERSISGAHWSVKVLPDPVKDFAGPARVSKPTEDRTDWHQALTVCRRYPSGSQQDSEERKLQMTPEQLQAARAVGFQRIAGSTSYDVKQIEAEFQHALKGAKP